MNEISDQDLEFLKYKHSILKAEHSLYEFFKQAWHIIEPGTPFVDNWHIEAIANHLEACFYRQIKRLLINMPPRCGKTNLISIVLPAWVWIHNPTEKFVYASYATSVSMEHSLKCRMLIESEWYQERWGHIYQLYKGQKAKSFFINNKTGYRITTSVKAAVTGKGGSFLVLDDVNNVSEGDTTRESVNKWFSQTWSTRRNDPKTSVMLNIQHRYHMEDNSGYILNGEYGQDWSHIMLPMEYEGDRKCKTVIPSLSGDIIWEDPRKEEGELLWPERFSKEEVEKLKAALGAYGAAGQLQQRPAPAEGGILKKVWFNLWKDKDLPDIDFVIQSWDTALTGKELSAYSACTTWGLFYDHNYVVNIILLSAWRGRVEFPELRKIAQRLYFDYRDIGKVRNPALGGKRVDMCLIEAKATGDALIRELHRAGVRAIPFYLPHNMDKLARARSVSPLLESGIVWIPGQYPSFERPVGWADEFLQAIASFPQSDSKDWVDTMSQAFMKLRDANYLVHPRDPQEIQPSYQEVRLY